MSDNEAAPNLIDETGRLEQENALLRDQLKRLAADADNYRKRVVREKDQAIHFANEALVTDLVPFLDSFDRLNAALGSDADDGLIDGVKLVQRQLEDTLERFGVSRFSTLGAAFDPERAEAIAVAGTDEDVPSGTVVEELQRGVALHGRILRPARVVVAG